MTGPRDRLSCWTFYRWILWKERRLIYQTCRVPNWGWQPKYKGTKLTFKMTLIGPKFCFIKKTNILFLLGGMTATTTKECTKQSEKYSLDTSWLEKEIGVLSWPQVLAIKPKMVSYNDSHHQVLLPTCQLHISILN